MSKNYLDKTLGVPGTKEDYSLKGAGIAVAAGVIAAPVSYMAIPFSPSNTATQQYGRNLISKTGGFISSSYMNYGISNQGPIRLGSGSIALPGGKLN